MTTATAFFCVAPLQQTGKARQKRTSRTTKLLQKTERPDIQLEHAKSSVLELASKARTARASTSSREFSALVDAIKELMSQTPTSESKRDFYYGETMWELVYSSSKRHSRHRIGPFDAYVEQHFTKGEDGAEKVMNTSRVGPFKAALGMHYENEEDSSRFDVTLAKSSLSLFGMRYTASAHQGHKGSWDEIYTDKDLRVVHGDEDAIFIMRRVKLDSLKACRLPLTL